MATTPKPNLSAMASEVKALARPFRAVIALADALEEVGGVENVAKEAAERRDKALKEADAAVKQSAQETARLATTKAKIADAEQEAARIVAAAKDAASKERLRGAEQAKAIIAEANEQADGINAKVAEQQKALAALRTQIGVARGEVATLDAEHKKLKQQFAALAR